METVGKVDLANKKTLILGLGRTGMAAATFLLDLGVPPERIRVSDAKPREELAPRVGELEARGVEVETEGHGQANVHWADVVVVSPGVPMSSLPVASALREGKEVISEIELAWRFIDSTAPVVAITGTNGKTTTAALVASILEAAGRRVFLGGNIGTPAVEAAVRPGAYDVLVLEVSSFQLQATSTFAPHVATLLNITPNHLDHHLSFEEYAASKMKIFSNQRPEDWAVYNASCGEIVRRLPRLCAATLPFATARPGPRAIAACGTRVVWGEERYELEGMRLLGRHNVENAMAAIAAARTLGVDRDTVERTIVGFAPLEHRLELVRTVRGAAIYNDSKSTSPDATRRALESVEPPVILIAGGKDKGTGFDPMAEAVREKVRLLILIGEAATKMEACMGGLVETLVASGLEEAVEMAAARMRRGDTVLFSPACSSFDMFTSYTERGRRFKSLVEAL